MKKYLNDHEALKADIDKLADDIADSAKKIPDIYLPTEYNDVYKLTDEIHEAISEINILAGNAKYL